MVIAALAAASVGLSLPLKDRGVRERWRRLAERLGLSFSPGRLLESDGMQGHLGPYPVRIDNQRRQGTRVSVSLRSAERLRIHPRHLWFFEAGERSEDLFELPDERLGRLLRQVGLARLFLLLLDNENEVRLDAGVYSAHLSVARGEVAFVCPERIDDPELIGVILGGLARLAEGLEEPPRLAERLGANARALSPSTGRKLHCLHLLLEHFPESPECGRTTWAIVRAPLVPTPEGVRLRLLALRHWHGSQPDEGIDASSETERSDIRTGIDETLRLGVPAIRAIAAEAMLALPPDQALPRLLEIARGPGGPSIPVALRLLSLVAQPGDLRTEKLLLDLLYRGDSTLRVDVVCAIGTVGTARCIGPLMDLERVADAGVRRVCRHALARLQSRYPERQSGSLSLVGTGGELSVSGE